MAVGKGLGQCFDAFGRLQKHFDSFILDGFGGKTLLGYRRERRYPSNSLLMNSEPEASDLSPASSEFASREWLAYLVKNKIGFRLRIKANHLITDKRGRKIHASKMLKTMKIGERAEFQRRRRLWNQSVFVAVCRKAAGDNVIIVSSERSGQILLEYGQRWQIETLFGCLKTRGFRLEDTHLTRGERISSLLSLLTLATVWGLLAGELTARQAPPKIKKHGRLEKSIFRIGLETLRNCFCQMTTNFRQKQRFQQLTLLLSCT